MVIFASFLASFAILTAMTLAWARWAKLDLGLSVPVMKEAEPWVLLLILWLTAEWAVMIFLPGEVDPEWLAQVEQLSFAEELVLAVLLAPALEELLYRGAMFDALLRSWGIWAAVLIPSVIWGLIHVQYDWWFVASIAGSGVLLAMIRWKSGSVYPSMALHAASNLLVTLKTNGLLGSTA